MYDGKEGDPLNRATEKPVEEDPYFDEGKDDKDEEWVGKNLAGAGDRGKTDAILNCPSCFTVLCLDCQRHVEHTEQYRAMFVTNCKVNCEYQLFYRPSKRQGKTRWERVEVLRPQDHDPQELFFPVQCIYCETEVAVYDHDEIYHFHNVITGY